MFFVNKLFVVIKHIVCVLNGRSSLGLNVEMTFSAEAA